MLKKHFNYKEKEKNLSSNWYNNKVYDFNKNIAKGNCFSVDTPPPTVSGVLHMGHVFSYVQADFIARYNRMQGKEVFYPMGFDDNGLPTERLVEKLTELKVGKRISSKAVKKLKNVGIDIDTFQDKEMCQKDDFIKVCNVIVDDAEKDFEDLFKTIALSVDWNLKYQTISPRTKEISHMSFKDLQDKGLIYKADGAVYWDCIDKTALAQADLEEIERDSQMNYIKFFLYDETKEDKKGQELTIMTTRPEMLSSCVALLYNKDDIRYNGNNDKNIYKDEDSGLDINAINLTKHKYAVTTLGVKVPLISDEDVKTDKGTGLVMCCTYGDWQDVIWQRRHNLPYNQSLTDYGTIIANDEILKKEAINYEQTRDITDKVYKNQDTQKELKIEEARKQTIEYLKESGDLVGFKPHKQAVKIAERSKSPIEILQKEQYYVRLMPFKELILKEAKKVKFHPSYMAKRLEQWIEGLNQDWCISRDRFFGIEIPSEDKQVLDTWFTSSITPQINSGYISNKYKLYNNLKDAIGTMTVRPQAHEIIRTWAFYTLAKSVLHSLDLKDESKKPSDNNFKPEDLFSIEKEQKTPWGNAMISGWCLAEDKTKMSKSKGNVVTPKELIEDKGVDVVRFWCSNSTLGADTAYSSQLLDMGKKFTIKLWNCAKFLGQKINNISQDEVFNVNLVTESFDKWILSRLEQVKKSYHKHLKEFEYAKARAVLDDFFWNDFCDLYLEVIKIRYYGLEAFKYKDKSFTDEEKEEIIKKQKSSIVATYQAFYTINKLYAIYCPYVCDEINKELFKKTISIHAKGSFDDLIQYNVDKDLEEKVVKIKDEIALVRKYKSDNNLALNALIPDYRINNEEILNFVEFIEDFENVTGVSQN